MRFLLFRLLGSVIIFLEFYRLPVGICPCNLKDWAFLQFIKGDLQSGDLLNYILRRENVDTVMHFAAQV